MVSIRMKAVSGPKEVVVAGPPGARGHPDDKIAHGYLDGFGQATLDEDTHRQAIVCGHVEAQEVIGARLAPDLEGYLAIKGGIGPQSQEQEPLLRGRDYRCRCWLCSGRQDDRGRCRLLAAGG